MEKLKSDELNGIFNNMTKKGRSQNKSRELPTFSDFLDPCRQNLSKNSTTQLHQNLIDTLINTENINGKNIDIGNESGLCSDKGFQKYKSNKSRDYQRNPKDNKSNENGFSRNGKFKKYKTNKQSSLSDNKVDNNLNNNDKYERGSRVNISPFLESFNLLNETRLGLYHCPNGELEQLLYCIISAIAPEFTSYTKELRKKAYKQVRDRLAYDLDEKDLYKQYNYKKVFKKYEAQSELLGNKPINEKWLQRYLSDYFKINISIIHYHLVYLSNDYQNRPSVFLVKRGRSLNLVTNNGSSLLSASLGKKIIEATRYQMGGFYCLSKYKLDELQEIAVALDIAIKEEVSPGKFKNRKKDLLYGDIKSILTSW